MTRKTVVDADDLITPSQRIRRAFEALAYTNHPDIEDADMFFGAENVDFPPQAPLPQSPGSVDDFDAIDDDNGTVIRTSRRDKMIDPRTLPPQLAALLHANMPVPTAKGDDPRLAALQMAALNPAQKLSSSGYPAPSDHISDSLSMESLTDPYNELSGRQATFADDLRPEPLKTELEHAPTGGQQMGPNYRPVDDGERDDEQMLESVQKSIGVDGVDDYDWEGIEDGVPSKADLEYVKENPTDGVLSDFFKAFPKYNSEDMLMRGGNPLHSPDQYAMDDDEWEELNKGRSTRIDER